MNFDNYIIADAGSFVIDGSPLNQEASPETAVAPAEGTATAPPETTSGAFGGLLSGGLGPIVLMLVFYGGFLYFMTRSQRKKEKALQEKQSAIKIGDEVYTSAGFYGKIVDTTTETFVVEFGTSKSVRIPVRKSEVFPVTVPVPEKK